MKIQSTHSITFGRKPSANELKVYTKSVRKGLDLLNKQLDIIIHNSAAPSVIKEDTGIGSLFSSTTQQKLIPFLKSHGISSIQQEPNNIRKIGNPSPYSPESSAKNIFMIPLEKLTTQKYGKILPLEVFNDIVKNSTKGIIINFEQVTNNYNKALKAAYNNFRTTGIFKDKFEEFKTKNSNELEKAAIFRILDSEYKKSWKEWDGIDKNLYSPKNTKQKTEAANRINELKEKYKEEIDYFNFQQFLVDLENKESNELSKQTGIKIIGDVPVAQPSAEEWANQHLFLKGKAIGCPPDYFSADGQRWDFMYYDPDKIFNKDGSLGEAGKILKTKYEKAFSDFPGGLRIDHVIGLVDPFIYTVKSKKMTGSNSGRIYSQFTGKYQKKQKDYSDMFDRIILPAAKKYSMDKNSIICEDLGEPNNPTKKVMKKLDLSGIAVTQFDYRGAKTPSKNVIMIGSHDNKSFMEFVDEDMFSDKGDRFLKKTELLAKDTAPKGITPKKLREYTEDIRNNKKQFIQSSFAELFTSPAKRIQIFFADFWGMNKTYNRPGTDTGNWLLRVNNDFENNYYQAVKEGKAPNLAKIIAIALRHKGLDKGNEQLMKDLDESAKILNE